MKVIAAGHQKTGTKTLNEALTILGYNVYDFMENYYYLNKEWKQIFNHGGNNDLFKQMYEDIDAVCDLPCLAFWEEIHKAHPKAKVGMNFGCLTIWRQFCQKSFLYLSRYYQ